MEQKNQIIQSSQPALHLLLDSLDIQQRQLHEAIKQLKDYQQELMDTQKLTQQLKQQIKQKIMKFARQLLDVQNTITCAMQIRVQVKYGQLDHLQIQALIDQKIQKMNIVQQSYINRYNQLTQNANQSTWTDATNSQIDQDQVLMLDQDIMKAMTQGYFQNQNQQNKSQLIQQQQPQQQKKQQFNFDVLQQQFITGQQSQHQLLFGKHDKFCVSVNGMIKNDLLLSGGGDDYLFMYRFPKQQTNKDKCLHPYHMVKHTQTINKIQISFNKQHIFTMTDNQVLCTQIKTQKTQVLKKIQNQQQMKDQNRDPVCSDMVCHHLGDVVAVSCGYQLQIFNVKGLKSFQTYYCQKMIDMFSFTDSGKQIVLGCQDNRIRILTPKTSQIKNVAGVKQHKAQLSVLKTKGDIVLTGDIDGYIGITSIKKLQLTAMIGTKQTQEVQGAVNLLQFAGNYFIGANVQDNIDWYDLNKAKRIYKSPINGSASDVCWQGTDYQNLYNVSTINGIIHTFDHRNPLKQTGQFKAGNTIHKLWCQGHSIAAACQDGHMRVFDVRKLL